MSRVFCYRCKCCDTREAHTALLADGNICPLDSCGGTIVRDYKAEAVGVDLAMLRQARA